MLKYEAMIRLGCFLGIFAFMAIWEITGARRARTVARSKRWPGNLGVSIIDALVTRIIAPAGGVGFAVLAGQRGWGIFHQLDWPGWAEGILAFLALDLSIYWQHRAFHFAPLLWRLHRMHHADPDVDVTTGARFHPIEIALSLGIKFAAISVLGASPVSVLLFEITLNGTSMFNHSNVRIPRALEPILRFLLVTPDMHRVHHSVIRRETDSNFGFNLPWWDRLLGTYQPEPEAGQDGVVLGLIELSDPAERRLDRMLTQPFRGAADALSRESRPPIDRQKN